MKIPEGLQRMLQPPTMPPVPTSGLKKLSSCAGRGLREITQPSGLASDVAQRVMEWIQDFEAEMDEGQRGRISRRNVWCPQVVHLQTITFADPNLIRILGINEAGEPVQLVQHIAQLSVLFHACRAGPKPNRIGFYVDEPGRASGVSLDERVANEHEATGTGRARTPREGGVLGGHLAESSARSNWRSHERTRQHPGSGR
ncbi:MAG: hypothetical protein IPK33_00730 [Gemmatimonadetes bacterium]|nr:hypothetical protein [Gemmatimonadota bacterium]